MRVKPRELPTWAAGGARAPYLHQRDQRGRAVSQPLAAGDRDEVRLHLVECGYRCGVTDVVTDVVLQMKSVSTWWNACRNATTRLRVCAWKAAALTRYVCIVPEAKVAARCGRGRAAVREA